MKKILSILLSVILIATMFVGCGNSSSKELTLANYVEKEDRIFLFVRGMDYAVPTKDDNISKIFVLKSDGTCIFSDTDKTLGELEQMEDSEIKEIAEQGYKKLIQDSVDNANRTMEDNISFSVSEEELKNALKTAYEDYNYTDDDAEFYGGTSIEKICDSIYAKSDLRIDSNSELGNKYNEIIKKNVSDCYSTKDYEKAGTNIYNELKECYESSEACATAKKRNR